MSIRGKCKYWGDLSVVTLRTIAKLALISICLAAPLSAEAATLRKRYVNTNSSAGGDGTTNATSGANRAYASLSAALAAEADDLVADDVYMEIECSGTSADTTAVDIDGFTLDATRYLDIYGATSHGGVWNTGIYRIEVAADNAVLIRDTHVRFRNLQVRNTQSNPSRGITLASGTAGGAVYIEKNIIRGPTSPGSDSQGIRSYTTNDGVRVRAASNIIYDFYDCIFFVTGDGDNIGVYFYNNTIASCSNYGIFLSAYGTNDIAKLRDNIIQNTVTSDYLRDGTFDTAFTTAKNITEDGSSPDAGFDSTTVSFENAGADDYHLDSADTEAKDTGDDLSADADYPFNFDIDGETRSGAWSIGADEPTAAANNLLRLLAIGEE